MKFETGNLYMTQGVSQLLERDEAFSVFVIKSLNRHISGDWGELGEEDKTANDEALENDTRIFSAYVSSDYKIWVITEWDRSSTTILFPSEY